MQNKIISFSVLILGGFLVVLFWLASVRLNDFHESQKSVAKETTDIVHLEIERQLAHKRLLVQIFLEDNYKNISYLAMNPHKEMIFKDLNARLERFFPDYFSVNIAKADGQPVIDDFEGNLGELCIEDMEHFSKHNKQLIRIHPNQHIYHYDILIPFRVDGQNMILFVSFNPNDIASLLYTSQADKHNLLLVQRELDYLIEVGGFGARNALNGRLDYRLDQSEKSRILSSDHVAGTLWDVVDLHEPGLFDDFKRSLIQDNIIVYVFFSAIILLVMGFLYWGERKRAGAEKQLRQKSRDVMELNSRLSMANEELQRHSITDGLTGVFNRRHLDQKVSEEWERAKRLGMPLTFVLIDVDCFKQYNDLYGHQAGDVCLKKIAEVLAKTFKRAGEFVARYGGEEFAAVSLGYDDESAFELGNKFKDAVAACGIEHKGSKVCDYVTVSVGIAYGVPSVTSTADVLIKEADEALYQAKTNGRNQVVVNAGIR